MAVNENIVSVIAGSLLRGAIRAYQLGVAPVLGNNCRYEPSCSHYAQEAIRLHGPLRCTLMALARIARCHPWHEGGYDPVPPAHSH